MAVKTSSGIKIHVTDAVATASTQTEFETLSYVEIGEISDGGEFGSEFNPVNFTALGDAIVRKLKGSEDPGTMQLQLGRDMTDAGQAQLSTALASYDDYGFKVEFDDQITPSTGNPTTFYFRGKVMSYRTQIGGADTVTAATCSIGITTRPIEVEAV